MKSSVRLRQRERQSESQREIQKAVASTFEDNSHLRKFAQDVAQKYRNPFTQAIELPLPTTDKVRDQIQVDYERSTDNGDTEMPLYEVNAASGFNTSATTQISDYNQPMLTMNLGLSFGNTSGNPFQNDMSGQWGSSNNTLTASDEEVPGYRTYQTLVSRWDSARGIDQFHRTGLHWFFVGEETDIVQNGAMPVQYPMHVTMQNAYFRAHAEGTSHPSGDKNKPWKVYHSVAEGMLDFRRAGPLLSMGSNSSPTGTWEGLNEIDVLDPATFIANGGPYTIPNYAAHQDHGRGTGRHLWQFFVMQYPDETLVFDDYGRITSSYRDTDDSLDKRRRYNLTTFDQHGDPSKVGVKDDPRPRLHSSPEVAKSSESQKTITTLNSMLKTLVDEISAAGKKKDGGVWTDIPELRAVLLKLFNDDIKQQTTTGMKKLLPALRNLKEDIDRVPDVLKAFDTTVPDKAGKQQFVVYDALKSEKVFTNPKHAHFALDPAPSPHELKQTYAALGQITSNTEANKIHPTTIQLAFTIWRIAHFPPYQFISGFDASTKAVTKKQIGFIAPKETLTEEIIQQIESFGQYSLLHAFGGLVEDKLDELNDAEKHKAAAPEAKGEGNEGKYDASNSTSSTAPTSKGSSATGEHKKVKGGDSGANEVKDGELSTDSSSSSSSSPEYVVLEKPHRCIRTYLVSTITRQVPTDNARVRGEDGEVHYWGQIDGAHKLGTIGEQEMNKLMEGWHGGQNHSTLDRVAQNNKSDKNIRGLNAVGTLKVIFKLP